MDEIVISGISCRLPESDNMDEFWDNLISGKDMVTESDRRWPPGIHGLPRRQGTLKDLSKFDAAFFGIPPKQAHMMDPQLRLLIECAQEAVLDSGYNPTEIKGTLTGCYMCSTHSDAHDLLSERASEISGYEMTGCNRTMLANRVSFSLDLKGPSMCLDTACSSGLEALVNAVSAIRDGRCDSAIVGAASVMLKPETSLQFMKLTMLSPEGACKAFDASGNGYVRSEGIVVMHIQKLKDARRAYATIAGAVDNCDGYKDRGITFPSGQMQKELLLRTYKMAGIDPSTVSYMEAHGTGTAAGDPQELNSITDAICANRTQPLPVGSVKSNMGHGEAVAGLAAIAKVILSMQHKMIPGNLHFNSPNTNIPALLDGRIQVVSKNTPWEGGTIGINSFGFGGANVHTILKPSSKVGQIHTDNSLKVVPVAGRNVERVKAAIELIKKHPDDLALHHMMANFNGPGKQFPCRGYTVLNAGKVISEVKECKDVGPIWFVFPGMGQQWHGMGKDMLQIPQFRASIDRAEKALNQEGFSVLDLIQSDDEHIFDDPLNAAAAITSIQVALVELLWDLGIQPDGLVGHSVGELGCAFADKTLTAEQTVRTAYWRGRCIKEAQLPPGGMAAVGLTWDETKKRIPKGVVAACHNGETSVTISGPKEDVANFVKELSDQGVFAREVNSSGVAFHSYFMKQCAPQLTAALEKVIPAPNPRTSRWISSSIPESEWDSSLASTSSAAYHVNNFTSSVLFHEAIQHIPKGAVVIEVGAQGLFQGILKKALSSKTFITSLMKKGEASIRTFFWSNIGKVHNRGVEIHPEVLYPKISYPVPMETPMLSSMMGWNHDTSWRVPQTKLSGVAGGGDGNGGSGGHMVEVAMSEENFIADHVLDGKILYPAMGYLCMAWEAFAKSIGVAIADAPVVFSQIHIHNATVMSINGDVTFSVNVSSSTGRFEVCEKGELKADGYIQSVATPMPQHTGVSNKDQAQQELLLNSDDFYKELRIRGYEYGPEFSSIESSTMLGEHGSIKWRGNWVTYLDALLQVWILQNQDRALRLPTRIRRLEIHPRELSSSAEKTVAYSLDPHTKVVTVEGVIMKDPHFTSTQRRIPHRPPLLEKFLYAPYIEHQVDKDYSVYTKACIEALCNGLNGNQLTGTRNHSIAASDIDDEHPLVQTNGKRSLPPINVRQKSDITGSSVSLGTILTGRIEGKHSLLDHIMRLQEDDNGSEKKREINWREDRLLHGSLHKQDLKAALDIYIENCLNVRIKLLILCPSDVLLYAHAAKIFRVTQQFPHAQFSITACTPDSESLVRKNFEQLNVKIGDWFFGNGAPPEHIASANVIVACNFLTDRNGERTREFGELCRKISPNTHLLVHEWNNCPELYAFVKEIYRQESAKPGPNLSSEASPTRAFLEEQGLDIILERNDGVLASLFSCRRLEFTPGRVEHVICNDLGYKWVQDIKARYELVKDDPNGRLWLISDQSAINGLVGMVACLLQEPLGPKLRCLLNADHEREGIPREFLPGGQGWESLVNRDLLMNAYCKGQFGSFRRFFIEQKYTEKATECALVESLNRGDLTSVKWVSVPPPAVPITIQTELIHVTYASMNFRDIMLASGRLSTDAIPNNVEMSAMALGLEFSGMNDFGERRMGIVPSGGMATEVSPPPQYLWPVPQGWTLADAASVPIAYVTAYYSLIMRGRIRKGERVLIHSGTSTVGQAAIRIALSKGCIVYSTVGTQEKVAFLQKEFGLPRDRISHSRDTTFSDDIMRNTEGHGVDVVLNSLSEEKLHLSIELLSTNGRFLEIGKFDLSNNSKMGMSVFLKNITFHGILVENLMDHTSSKWVKVWKLVQGGIAKGVVKPLNTHIFESHQLEKAFRFMGHGTHIGKVLIKVRPEGPYNIMGNSGKKMRARKAPVKAIGRTYFSPAKVYIITGGLGGLGLELANWMVRRGARNLALTSRSGVKTGYQKRLLSLWAKQGVDVHVSNKDVSIAEEAQILFSETDRMGPVGGVFHLAAVLKDIHFENMTMDKWRPVTDAKVTGTINLDKITRAQCANSLDYFITFSSCASGYGNAGQSNYGYGNSYMERLCEKRQRDGFPGQSIQWGFIGDVGIVQDSLGGNKLYHLGMVPQRIESFLETIDLLLQMPEPVVSSCVPADRRALDIGGGGDAPPEDEVANIVMNILGVDDLTDVDPTVPLSEFGLDSLMTTEIRQTLGRRFNLQLSVAEVQSLSLESVKDMIKNA